MGDSTKKIYILYGSQTGNGESIAQDLHQQLLDMGMPAECMNLNSVKKTGVNLKQTAICSVIICSTTGNGDAPENACNWWRSVKLKSAAKDAYEGVSYAVLGLGDTNYDKFNFMAKAIDKRLSELGGTRMMSLDCADEATDMETTIEAWKLKVVPAIQAALASTLSVDKSDSKTGEDTKIDNGASSCLKKLSIARPDGRCDDIVACNVMSPECIAQWIGLDDPAFFTDNEVTPTRAKKGATYTYTLRAGAEPAKTNFLSPPPSPVRKGPSAAAATAPLSGALSQHNTEYTAENPYTAQIASARWLTSAQNRAHALHEGEKGGPAWGTVKRVVHVDVSLGSSGIVYTPGDSMGIMRPNPTATVEMVLRRLNKAHEKEGLGFEINEHTIVVKTGTDGKVVEETTVGEILFYSLDFVGPPRKTTVSSLAQYCTDIKEQHVLRNLSGKTPNSKKMWSAYVEDQCLNIAEILSMFPSCTPAFTDLLRCITPLPPRYFSIASCPLTKQHKTFSFAFSIVRYSARLSMNSAAKDETPPIIRRNGFCTTSLEELLRPWLQPMEGDPKKSSVRAPLRIFHKPNPNFQLPGSITAPLILVGPGTGVSPFVGFLEHRSFLKREKSRHTAAVTMSCGMWRGGFELDAEDLPCECNNVEQFIQSANAGDIHLFYGCRDETDYLYKPELNTVLTDGVLTSLSVAMSRVTQEKIYVTHKIKERAPELAHLILEKKAYIYICGDGNQMAKDVHETIKGMLMEHGSMNDKEAGAYLQDLRARKRYLLDVWS